MKVALYARVSTDEQARFGLSVDTQLADMREWAKANNHQIVGEYVDAGISGKKPYAKRPALSAFLSNMDGVDALVFTKLDRFFRSVRLYYEAVAVMEQHGVGWISTQEDYETVTSSGRFKVNIMLSVAESEADRTSERVKVIMDAKKARRELLSSSLPHGYRADGKYIAVDENAVQDVKTLFATYALTGSYVLAIEDVERKTGYKWTYISARDAIVNESYLGTFYGVRDYAPAILTREEWDAAQAAHRRYVKTNLKRTYIFAGICRCGVCGGSYNGRTNTERCPSYACNRHAVHNCDNKVMLSERKIEAYLLDHVEEEFPAYAKSIKVSARSEKEAAALKKRAAKLQDLYMLDMITLDELKRQKEQIDAKLAAITKPVASVDQMRKALDKDWKTLYAALDPMGKRMFWRSLIKEIRIYPDRHVEFTFL